MNIPPGTLKYNEEPEPQKKKTVINLNQPKSRAVTLANKLTFAGWFVLLCSIASAIITFLTLPASLFGPDLIRDKPAMLGILGIPMAAFALVIILSGLFVKWLFDGVAFSVLTSDENATMLKNLSRK